MTAAPRPSPGSAHLVGAPSEDFSECRLHRETRRLALTAAVAVIAETADGICDLHLVPRESVLAASGTFGASNKGQAVRLFVERFPELQPNVPPGRFIWQSEDARWAIFDPLALAIVTLSSTGSPTGHAE